MYDITNEVKNLEEVCMHRLEVTHRVKEKLAKLEEKIYMLENELKLKDVSILHYTEKLVARNGRIMVLEQEYEKSIDMFNEVNLKNHDLVIKLADIKYINRGEVEKIIKDSHFTYHMDNIEYTGFNDEAAVTAICKLALPIDCYSKEGEII